ncbi:MAG TPA: heterodisulfide reductase-related iron-sulfur binding cluster [Gammaproteobacteria bacterium]|nr:heterodisulfide reductase-related iron-sulfur binding cluster [Gammaproteobacteria bacterium]
MQTSFSAEQLQDPVLADAERTLRRCVHCGFCTATCPTYVLLGDELDSPRGRIYLIKEMLENRRPATAEVVRHLDRCLSCLGCVTACPSGVDYQHLIDHARVHVEKTYRRPWSDRLLRAALAGVLPYPRRFGIAVRIAKLARPAAMLMPGRVRRVLELAARQPLGDRPAPGAAAGLPPARQGAAGEEDAAIASPHAEGRPRVALLGGCVQSVLAPRINAAAVRLLTLAGAEVVSVPGCCGAIVHHLGRESNSRVLAKTLIDKLSAEIDTRGLHAIAVTASGCGTHLKDFGYVFRSYPELAEPAAAVAARTRDITEILDELGLPEPRAPSGLTVAYHSACSLQHGQKVERPPRALLERAGFVVEEIPEGHLCCGSAGTYNLLQPALAARLRDRKLENIASVRADVVAAGNIGCIAQLASADGRPVVHTVELLDWAMGGPGLYSAL